MRGAETPKALARGISFNPPSLAERAENYGKDCRPVRSISSVVCEALQQFLDKHAPVAPRDWDADRIAAITTALRRDPSAIGTVETALTRRSRRRRTDRKAA